MKSLALLLLVGLASAAEGGTVVRSSMGGDIAVDTAPDGARLRTMGGDIRVKSANGELVARTMGGNIRVSRLEGSLVAGTMGGNVDVEVVGTGKRSVEIHSMGGTVEITLPADFAGNFDLELEYDDDDDPAKIQSDFPLKITESKRRSWFHGVTVITATGVSGGGGNRVRITAHGGNITIRRK